MLDHPPVFADPFARLLLSDEARAILETDPGRGNRGALSSSLRAFLAVRSRIAEDRLAAAVGAGVRQYVLLGAGLDTFACRNPFPDLRVFEVDHPRTQAWKRERLAAAEVTLAPGTRFVPVDFERDSLSRSLAEHGFDPKASTAISWLGVVPYLEVATIWTTLAWAAAVVGDRGHIVFDYGSRPRWWQLGQRLALRALAGRVAAAGEPFRTTLRAGEVRERLLACGFAQVEDLDAAAMNREYFSDRADGLRLRGSGHVAIASRGAVKARS